MASARLKLYWLWATNTAGNQNLRRLGRSMVDQSDSPLYGGNAAFLEELYQRYRERPEAVGAEWRRYFAALARAAPRDVAHHALREALVEEPQHRRTPAAPAGRDIPDQQ